MRLGKENGDRYPHIEKTTRYYNQTGSDLESAGYEKRKTKEYMKKRLGKR
jgi:hypothetical protein